MSRAPLPSPPSPCVQVCTLDARGEYCIGCLRTLAEIAGWGSFTAAQRWALLNELQLRAERQFGEIE